MTTKTFLHDQQIDDLIVSTLAVLCALGSGVLLTIMSYSWICG